MAARSSPDWLIYALGGGWGHLTRAVALARAASPSRSVRILTSSPYASHVLSAMPELDLAIVDESLPVAAAREQAIRQIQAASAPCLIVDTFPRGLVGELANILHSMPGTKVLVHRDLNPRYVSVAGLRRFVASRYDLVLIPGETEGAAFPGTVTAPWLIREPGEHPAASGPVRILVSASGPAGELAWYGETVACLLALHPPAAVRCFAPTCPPGCPRECWIMHWPASDLYASAGVIIGGGGYNTIHECLAYNIPLIARPWPRKYDRQWLRAKRAARRGSVTIVKQPREAALAAMRELTAGPPHHPSFPFRNGAKEAAALIERETRND